MLAEKGTKTPSGNIKLSPEVLREFERMHLESVRQEREERERRRLAEAQANAYQYTLRQLQTAFEEMEKAAQSISGNFSKLFHRVSAGKIAVTNTLDKRQ